jgi:hypothetical protein
MMDPEGSFAGTLTGDTSGDRIAQELLERMGRAR